MNRSQRHSEQRPSAGARVGTERRIPGRPQRDRERIAKAIDLHLRGKYRRAGEIFRRFLEDRPDNARVLNFYGYALRRSGKIDDAVRCLTRSVGLDSTNPLAHNNLGNALKDQGKPDQALASFRRAVVLDPGSAAALNNLGNVQNDLGALEEAGASYRRAIDIDGGFAQAHYNLGNVLRDQGRLEECVACYRTAVSLDPGYAFAYNNLGNVLRGLGEFDEAAASYRLAVAADPGFVLAFHNLASLFNEQERHPEALAAYREVLSLDPGNESARHMVAALGGEAPAVAPRGFIRDTFDSYAPMFDRHLQGQLDYRVPAKMREAVERFAEGQAGAVPHVFGRALDLGCGTGLVAARFRDRVTEIDGVDLSPNMLAEARLKRLYDRLHEGDVIEFLERGCGPGTMYDLVLAADLFIYIGDLRPVFAGVARRLSQGGVFVFSTERAVGVDYELRPTGRYAQSDDYIRGLAADHGFHLAIIDDVEVRKEKTILVEGAVFVLRKMAA